MKKSKVLFGIGIVAFIGFVIGFIEYMITPYQWAAWGVVDIMPSYTFPCAIISVVACCIASVMNDGEEKK